MCILYGDCVNLFECLFDFMVGNFSWSSKHFINGMCAIALAPSEATFHPYVVRLF